MYQYSGPSWFAGSHFAVSLRGTFIVRSFTQGRSLMRWRACVNARYFTLEAAFVRLSHSVATYISCDTKRTSTVLSAIFRTNLWPLTMCCNYVQKVRCTSCWWGKRVRTGPGALRCKRIDYEFDQKMKTRRGEGKRPVFHRVCGKMEMVLCAWPEDTVGGCHGTTQGVVPGDAESQGIEDRTFLH